MKASDNLFARIKAAMQTANLATPSDSSWNLFAKADGFYAQSSNAVVGPLGAAGASSFGSNAMAVGATNQAGTSGTYIGADHRHLGLHSITSSSSNTLWRPTVNIRPGANIALTASDSDGDGNLDTVTISGSAGGSGTTNVGYLPFAYPAGLSPATTFATNDDMAANGGSYLIPFFLPSSMKLHGVSVRNENTTLARSWEFRLYLDTNSSVTLNEVANANGSESFTASVASIRTATCATPPTLLPGAYWLVVRNTHATNTFRTSFAAAGGTNMDIVNLKLKTLGSALGSTLDCDTSWTTSENIPGIALRGRVMGESTLWD